jgi:hypothetical protein
VPETAGAEEHQRKQKQVVTGMHNDAGREGSKGKANPAESQTDADEK